MRTWSSLVAFWSSWRPAFLCPAKITQLQAQVEWVELTDEACSHKRAEGFWNQSGIILAWSTTKMEISIPRKVVCRRQIPNAYDFDIIKFDNRVYREESGSVPVERPWLYQHLTPEPCNVRLLIVENLLDNYALIISYHLHDYPNLKSSQILRENQDKLS